MKGLTIHSKMQNILIRWLDISEQADFIGCINHLIISKKIRILVGLNVDKQSFEIIDGIRQEKLDFDSQTKIKQQYQDEVKKNLRIRKIHLM